MHSIEGRDLGRSFRKDCARCRLLAKRTVEVIMDPVSKVKLILAPAFYISQVDLFEQMDLLTPNRLMLGRNNERSSAGPLYVSNDSDKIIEQNANIMKTWFECWLVSHVPKLMEESKWFSSDRDFKAVCSGLSFLGYSVPEIK